MESVSTGRELLSTSSEAGMAAEIVTSFSILVFLILLGLSITVAYILERTKFKYIHETFLSIVIGATTGAVIKYSNAQSLQTLLTFDTEFFFFLLLPPIIFSSGYDLKRKNFFKNFGSILMYAFIGTTISTFVVGFLLWGIVLTGIADVNLDVIDCLVFGALISATDPVTVLAIFHSLHVDPKLYALVFGESILNDAVAIVLFETLKVFKTEDITVTSIFLGFGNFIGIFFGSFAIGAFLGCFSALVFKHTKLGENPMLESGMFIVFAYSSYLFAQGVRASGIVAMLFCGIFMAHYTYDNLSTKSQNTTKYVFQLLAFLSENFIFIYLGITLFTKEGYSFKPVFILFTFLAIMIARVLNVYPLSFLINMFTKKAEEKISQRFQFMMWWAGLRGAIAFALSMQITWEAGPVIVTTTLMIVVITVVVFGTPTTVLLSKLKIPIGVEDHGDEMANFKNPEEAVKVDTQQREEKYHWFMTFDRKYLKPFFRAKKEYVTISAHPELSPEENNDDEHLEMDEIPVVTRLRSDLGE